MHIPDGFLNGRTATAMWVISASGLGIALRQARRNLPPRRVPLMGLAAAFIFAAQMLNFPVAGGTSGHLVGGVLAAVLLGPSAAFIVISAVLILQALLFFDGGIMALGANIFNMGLISAVGGWGVYALVCKMLIRRPSDVPGAEGGGQSEEGGPNAAAPNSAEGGQTAGRSGTVLSYASDSGDGAPMPAAELRARLVAAAFASWVAVVVAAVACAAELAISGTVSWSVVFPAMMHVHMLIGVGEGVITAMVLLAVARARPELIRWKIASARGRYRELAVYGLLISLGLALFVSPFASKWPDGLDRTSERLGFDEKMAPKPALPTPAAGYKFPGIGSATLATSLAGAVGTTLAFGLSLALARVLVPKRKEASPKNPVDLLAVSKAGQGPGI